MSALKKYEEQIRIIKKMGFEDEILMIEYLEETNGNLNATTIKLVATLNNPQKLELQRKQNSDFKIEYQHTPKMMSGKKSDILTDQMLSNLICELPEYV